MSSAAKQGHSGWLTKRGGQIKNWKRRWFRVKGDVLFYYKTPNDSTEQGYIPLAGSQVLRRSTDPKTPEKHMFEIAAGARRMLAHHHESFLLYADTSEEMETWISVLNRIIREPQGGGMFGRSIAITIREEARRFGKGFVPVIVEKTVSFLRERGLDEVGIFRLPGNQVRVTALRESFDKGENPNISPSEDNHTVASLLKLYLRELPEPLIPFEYYDMFVGSARVLEKDESKGVQQVIKQFKFLPKANFDVLKYLCRFLNEIQQHSETNKMTLGNVATVFGPNFMSPQSSDPHSLMESTNLMALLTKSMISKHEVMFPQTEDEVFSPKRGNSPGTPKYKMKHSMSLGPRATIQDVFIFADDEDDVAFRGEFRSRQASAPSSTGGSFRDDKEEKVECTSPNSLDIPPTRTNPFSEDLEKQVRELNMLLEAERKARLKAESELEQERKARYAWETRYRQEAAHRQDADRHCSELRQQLDAFCASLSSPSS